MGKLTFAAGLLTGVLLGVGIAGTVIYGPDVWQVKVYHSKIGPDLMRVYRPGSDSVLVNVEGPYQGKETYLPLEEYLERYYGGEEGAQKRVKARILDTVEWYKE